MVEAAALIHNIRSKLQAAEEKADDPESAEDAVKAHFRGPMVACIQVRRNQL